MRKYLPAMIVEAILRVNHLLKVCISPGNWMYLTVIGRHAIIKAGFIHYINCNEFILALIWKGVIHER
jgi:hypothetical protein